MEMDRQTIMVLCCAIIGLTLFGGIYLAAPQSQTRPTYAPEDIRYKFQKEEAKKPKPAKRAAVEPVISSRESTSRGTISSDDESNEEPSIFDNEDSHEEPPLE